MRPILALGYQLLTGTSLTHAIYVCLTMTCCGVPVTHPSPQLVPHEFLSSLGAAVTTTHTGLVSHSNWWVSLDQGAAGLLSLCLKPVVEHGGGVVP